MFKDLARWFALAAICFPIISHAQGEWWNEEWQFRKEITVDLSAAGANVAGGATDVPVLVRLHLGNFGYFADTKPDGADLRFIATDAKTPLEFHIERYDPTAQMAFIWVRIPQVAGGTANTKFWMYYGNAESPAASDSGGTYDPQQAAVYHFDAEGAPRDSSANNNAASSSAGEYNAASLIAGGLRLTGTNAITVPASPSLRVLANRGATLSVWVRLENPQSAATVLRLGDNNGALALVIDGLRASAQLERGGAAAATAQAGSDLGVGQWHHLALVAANNRLALLIDGVEAASAQASMTDISGALLIGGAGENARFFAGEIDEVQVANAARTADWLRIAAVSQGMDSKAIVYGGDSQKEGGGTSYFAITMKNVTIDGWVVIIILAVMFVIAMMIMVVKALMLGRIKTSNAEFLAEFERLKNDITVLDRDEDKDAEGDSALDQSPFLGGVKEGEQRFRLSTLYRLYHSGVQEMTHRVGFRPAGAQAVNRLTPQAIEAIRASMDASLVRLTQKLQSKMVFLTIAISGGPFLGLLGTVVGVMITFAAIAASGDVNVNSIAPGIAAALAATVAGLGVAIPALFGYNWLNTQIKEINADMHVFVDEFVTRIAEHYS